MISFIRSPHRIFESFLIGALISLISLPASAMDMINVVVYGDSLTSGYKLPSEDSYADQMGKKLRDLGYVNVKTINMSVPGETSSGGLERVSSLILQEPDVVVLELGANDILRGTSVHTINRNLANIITKLREKDVYIVLIGMYAPPNLGAGYSGQIKAMYANLATYYKLAFYPFALDGIFGNPDMNLADGYHPNGKGIGLMVDKTLHMVDAGVRWKYEVLRQREEYERGWQESQSPAR
ncbi:MAG: arylesterase [Alphaproteobacteria bacterium]